MGTYRFLLAVAVMFFHAGVLIQGRAIGVEAVVSFNIISGYVMTALVDRHYSNRIGGFYIDRAMRLFPQFLLYLFLTLSIIYIIKPMPQSLDEISAWRAALNLTMVGLNIPRTSIMPQAWSLGLEWQFYLLLPFMLRARTATFVASLLMFAITVSTAWINPAVWGYYELPGTAFMFLTGSFLYRSDKPLIWVVYAAMCAGFVVTYFTPGLQDNLRFEVLAGVVIGVPVVKALSMANFGKFDAFMGNLSYGVFLNHFALRLIFQVAGFSESSRLYLPMLLVTSSILSWISYELIEKRVIAIRHKIRNIKSSERNEEVGAGSPAASPPTAL